MLYIQHSTDRFVQLHLKTVRELELETNFSEIQYTIVSI